MLGHILAFITNKFILSLIDILGVLNNCKATLINLLHLDSQVCIIFGVVDSFSFNDFVVVAPFFY